MNILAIETATGLVGAALRDGDGRTFDRAEVGARRHAEALAPAIAAVCDDAGVGLHDVDLVAVDAGPGLFTGLRVGVATAKALGQALGIGVLPVRSLDVLAAAARRRLGQEGQVGGSAPVLSVVDARRGELFVAGYRWGGDAAGDPATLSTGPPELCAPERLAEIAKALGAGSGGVSGGRVVVVGDGAARLRDVLAAVPGVDDALIDGPDPLLFPPPTELAGLAAVRVDRGAVPAAPGDVVPEYLRDADARINWEQRLPPAPAPPMTPA